MLGRHEGVGNNVFCSYDFSLFLLSFSFQHVWREGCLSRNSIWTVTNRLSVLLYFPFLFYHSKKVYSIFCSFFLSYIKKKETELKRKEHFSFNSISFFFKLFILYLTHPYIYVERERQRDRQTDRQKSYLMFALIMKQKCSEIYWK